MSRQGQRRHGAHDPSVSPERNNPKRGETITTGTYNKPETYREGPARPVRQPRLAPPDTRPEHSRPSEPQLGHGPSDSPYTRARLTRSGSGGSDSNEHR